jgi:molybdenum cofactor biosynthesis protein B
MAASVERQFEPLGIAVLTVSDSRTPDNDRSGDTLCSRLTECGHRLVDRRLVIDDVYVIRAVVSDWIARGDVHVVLVTGGTGVTGRDGTPEAIGPLLDKRLEGFGELFRWLSFEEIGTSTIQSRALAGVANSTYLFCLPGSPKACATAWDRILHAQLDYRTRPCNFAELLPRLGER